MTRAVDIRALRAAQDLGHVTCDVSPDHGLLLWNYTPRCVHSGAWTPTTIAARGLVTTAEGEVVAQPWGKFFNLGEEHAPDVTGWGEPEEITEKVDGSLGIGFTWQGRMVWTTRGSWTSPQGRIAAKLWGDRPPVPWGTTLMAEIVHPDTRVVVTYPDERLILLGVRALGVDQPHDAVGEWARAAGLDVVERHPARSLAELAADVHTWPSSREGVVCRWGNTRVKVKGAAYLAAHRVVNGITERRAADYWYAGMALPEVAPEETRDWFDGIVAELDAEAAAAAVGVTETVAPVLGLPRKEAAIALRGSDWFPEAMAAYSGRSPDLKLAVYRRRFDGSRPRGLPA